MRRYLKAIFVLLLGAMVNIVVALGSFAQQGRSSTIQVAPTNQIFCSSTRVHTRLDVTWWIPEGVAEETSIDVIVEEIRHAGRTGQRTNLVIRGHPDGARGLHFTVCEAGWPARSLWGFRTNGNRYMGIQPKSTLIPVGRSGVAPRVELPTRPIWPGLAANTLFYGALIAAAWCCLRGVRPWRRRRRRGRNNCPDCGYVRAGIPAESKCPECGAPAA
jgi:ssDNA-binding Zn-finger/Zn-ribbon topoisomerase 1